MTTPTDNTPPSELDRLLAAVAAGLIIADSYAKNTVFKDTTEYALESYRQLAEQARRLDAERSKMISHIDDLHIAHEVDTERIKELEALIDECCSLRDVMTYPNGEAILNSVRAKRGR